MLKTLSKSDLAAKGEWLPKPPIPDEESKIIDSGGALMSKGLRGNNLDA